MQKQHLHLWLPLLFAALLCGCGEPRFPQLNPYLHGEQVLSLTLSDSVDSDLIISGWTIEAEAPLPGTPGDIHITTPNGRKLAIAWKYSGDRDGLPFRPVSRKVRGIEFTGVLSPLTLSLSLSADGRRLTCDVVGPSQRELSAGFEVTGTGSQVRGIAAYENHWEVGANTAKLTLPWGEVWSVESQGQIIPDEKAGKLGATINFPAEGTRTFTIALEPLAATRGLDVVTESDQANRALALLVNMIPPNRSVKSLNDEQFEFFADMTTAQWIAHAEPVAGYFKFLEVPEEQITVLSHSISAFRTAYEWGTLSEAELTAHEVILDEALGRIHQGAHMILLGASLEDRLREAAIWSFAETHLTSGRVKARDSYRGNSLEAVRESQKELRSLQRHFKIMDRIESLDTVYFEDHMLGETDIEFVGDSVEFREIPRPDTLALLRICARGELAWLTEANKEWHTPEELPWEIALTFERQYFLDNLKAKEPQQWLIAEAALLDPANPAVLPGDRTAEAQMRATAAQLESVVSTYLGIRPVWSSGKIVFDARLPAGWGRTRARVPFDRGELYVDYDFENNLAWIASRGLMKEFDCQIYMPTATGAISCQFTLEPGEGPLEFNMIRDNNNAWFIQIESSDLPE